MNWKNLSERVIKSPYTPHLSSDIDVSNFDKEFTKDHI